MHCVCVQGVMAVKQASIMDAAVKAGLAGVGQTVHRNKEGLTINFQFENNASYLYSPSQCHQELLEF
jgi:hypothetical protein